ADRGFCLSAPATLGCMASGSGAQSFPARACRSLAPSVDRMADTTRLRALAEAVTARTGFTRAIGTRVIGVGEGEVQLAVDRRPDLLQFNGHFHGGVIAALADHAAGGAVTTALPAGRIAVTIDLHVNYLAPALGETLIAKAKALRVGSTLSVA